MKRLVCCSAIGAAGMWASVFATPSGSFVEAARAAYATSQFAAYTNSVVRSFVGKPADMLDTPREGDVVGWVAVSGVRNVRDIGGWNGLRKGRVYRGSEMNDVGDHGLQIDDAGRKVILEKLGVRTELDFRAVNAKSRGACVKESALGPGVRLVNAPIDSYTNMFVQTDLYASALRVFADEGNFPVYMHCWGGADRTGTIAFILEGLCGVSEIDLAIDYELTSFSMFGMRLRTNRNKDQRYADIIARIKAYPGETLAEKFAAYARGTLGLSEGEIAAIRRNLAGGK